MQAMSTTQSLVQVLKAELKRAGITYAALARELGLAESSVKRMLSRGDMPLARVDAICHVLKTDFAELARQVAEAQAQRPMLTVAQEAAVVADPRLLLLALCVLSQWTAPQIVATYRMTEAECVAGLARLDALGLIELRAGNRYRLRVTKTLRWRPDGPLMQYFRQTVVHDFFQGSFDGEDELLMLVHGQLSQPMARVFNARLQRVAEDFAQQHLVDQRLPPAQKRPFTLLIGQRSWLFAGLRAFRRQPDGPVVAAVPGDAGPGG
jgi:lambda repressor-like predicted transcriptional regulator